ncbi:MAG: DoxX family protein [Myxococcales bacterium]|nr:MAG: DoxX family protein [Myxococcales bacterium]
MQTILEKLTRTQAPAAVWLIRLAVGGVFLSEGAQKFLFPAALGAGRFAAIGIPWPEAMGPFVGVVEIAGGLLILSGLLTRLAALSLAVNMVVAITSTKIPMLLGQGFWGFADPAAGKQGFWAMAHEARTDFSMLLGAVFLLIVGAGAWSLDVWLGRRFNGES